MNIPVTDRLMSMSRSFMESRIILTGAELDIYTLLSNKPLSATEVCSTRGGDLRAVTMLLDALTGFGALEKANNRYRLAPEADRLSMAHPQTILPLLLHSNNLWNRWSQLTSIISPQLPEMPNQGFNSFIGAMHSIGAPLAERIVQSIQPDVAKNLLDVGGASGTYTIAFLRSCPEMHATIFDRPDVIELARERLLAEGLMDRVTLVGGDMMSDMLPGGQDLIYLSAIIHMNSLEQNRALYRNCYQATAPGGRIIIRDHIMSEDHTQPAAGAIFAINMLCGTSGGGTYTYEEIKEGLESAGYSRVKLIQPDNRMDGLVEAYR